MDKKIITENVKDDEVLEVLREIGVNFTEGCVILKMRPIIELLAQQSQLIRGIS